MSDLAINVVKEYILDNYRDVLICHNKPFTFMAVWVNMAHATNGKHYKCEWALKSCYDRLVLSNWRHHNSEELPYDDIAYIMSRVDAHMLSVVMPIDYTYVTRITKISIHKHVKRVKRLLHRLNSTQKDKDVEWVYSGMQMRPRRGQK